MPNASNDFNPDHASGSYVHAVDFVPAGRRVPRWFGARATKAKLPPSWWSLPRGDADHLLPLNVDQLWTDKTAWINAALLCAALAVLSALILAAVLVYHR